MKALQQYFDDERGRRLALAKALGITPGAVSQWDRVPAEHVFRVAAITGISVADLRPDMMSAGSAPEAA